MNKYNKGDYLKTTTGDIFLVTSVVFGKYNGIWVNKDLSFKNESCGGWSDSSFKGIYKNNKYTWTSKFNIGDVVQYGNQCYFILDIIFSDNRVEYTIVSSTKEFFTGETIYFDRTVVREEQLRLYEKPKVEELTLEEVCKELGRDIKIVK